MSMKPQYKLRIFISVIVLLLQVCLAQRLNLGVYQMQEEEPDEYCKSTTEFNFNESTQPRDKSSIFHFCKEHQKFTCCMAHDVDRIHNRYSHIKDAPYLKQTQYQISKDCLEMTRQFWCSNCDGDLGTHAKHGYCELRCTIWYLSCKNDYFVPISNEVTPEGEKSDEIATLQFPMDGDDLWKVKQLKDLYQNSEEFCKDMGGYEVNHDADTCYDGIPSATKHDVRQADLRRHHEKHGIDNSTLGKLITFVKMFKKNSIYLLYASFLVMAIYAVYLAVAWQDRKAEQWIEEEKKQKRKDKVNKRRAERRAQRTADEQENKLIADPHLKDD